MAIGRRVSHFEILEKIGEGGMGKVYLAHDTKLDRRVALKFLPSDVEGDATEKKRFLRGARAAAALAPRRKRFFSVASPSTSEGRNFRATRRSSFVSWAR